MDTFLQRFGTKVTGHLDGFDRLRFRGSKRRLCYPEGILTFLCWIKVLLKDFGIYAHDTTKTLCAAIERKAEEQDLPTIYVASSTQSKEEVALAQAKVRGLTSGLIGVLSCVEPCRSVVVRSNKEKGLLEPCLEERKCLHYYHYYLDAKFGLMYTRLQSWFPFTMHIGINGREWLAEQLKKAQVGYVKVDNCFTAIADFAKAQRLLNTQVKQNWSLVLERLAARSNPLHRTLLPGMQPYYWSVDESEWASDFLFRTPADLAAVYPLFVRHGIETMHSADVMRFLGYQVPATGRVHGNFEGEVLTDLQRREEGTRVKYQVKSNSAKMYDKHGNLRLETTLNNVREFKTIRTAEGDAGGKKKKLKMRKGVQDIQARVELSQQVNERHASFLASALATEPLGKLVEKLCAPVQWRGRRVRGLNPWAAADVRLLETIGRGEFMLTGFRNRDVRALLHGTKKETPEGAGRQSAAVTRQLRMLQAHGLIEKQKQAHRYVVTLEGQRTITALLTARRADTATLMGTAA
jgi:hypothetical protein